MSSKNFLCLLGAVSFGDMTSKQERKLTDKLAQNRYILDAFALNCKNNYVLGEFMTIDEMLTPYRRRCRFIQYLPKKSAKYGPKMVAFKYTF